MITEQALSHTYRLWHWVAQLVQAIVTSFFSKYTATHEQVTRSDTMTRSDSCNVVSHCSVIEFMIPVIN